MDESSPRKSPCSGRTFSGEPFSSNWREYPNAIRFTDDDMLLIKNPIQRVKANPNPETKKFAIELANKSAELIGLEETPDKRLKFLQTLLHDYVVLTR